jgi:hypothetical protein
MWEVKVSLHFFPMALQPLVDQGLLVIEGKGSHSDTPLDE